VASCSTCHEPARAFTDSPLKVSEGIDKLTGTRNAPTVVDTVYFGLQFWDGRSPFLEDQALHPFVNPVGMGLKDHESIPEVVRSDSEYAEQFETAFGKSDEAITMTEVTRAIAAFGRTQVSAGSPFDRWHFGGESGAQTQAQKRNFEIFVNQGRCVSYHVVEQTQALFTDNRCHNVGVGVNDIQEDVPDLAGEFLKAEATLVEVDVKVLGDRRTWEPGTDQSARIIFAIVWSCMFDVPS